MANPLSRQTSPLCSQVWITCELSHETLQSRLQKTIVYPESAMTVMKRGQMECFGQMARLRKTGDGALNFSRAHQLMYEGKVFVLQQSPNSSLHADAPKAARP